MNAQGYQLAALLRADAEDCPRPDRAQLLTQAAGEIEKQIAEIKALQGVKTALRALINAPQITTSEHHPLVIAARAALGVQP